VHLNQNVQRRRVVRPLLGEASRDPFAVDGMRPMKALGDEPRLVALYPADEVPDDVEVRERVELPLGFLGVALAEMTLSGTICELNGFDGLLFADCDDRHVVGVSPRGECRNANTFANRRQMLRAISHALS